MSRSAHDARNLEQIALLHEHLDSRVGSGYRPRAWCLNPGCHEPIDPACAACPHCGHPQALPVPTTVSQTRCLLCGRDGCDGSLSQCTERWR
ncbi:hypothetical protein [Deinococcus budaensis]|uniref:Uncharacterized protein n=1 Tax=Deinococcus budaensis TaxID=1665626 RepID=A0A7W8GF63_9DEIO|nr:hypothetical protein [Deinococcus budaensis]MBB5234435.1 hypothetical protein [Deinococcus budaensis]